MINKGKRVGFDQSTFVITINQRNFETLKNSEFKITANGADKYDKKSRIYIAKYHIELIVTSKPKVPKNKRHNYLETKTTS